MHAAKCPIPPTYSQSACTLLCLVTPEHDSAHAFARITRMVNYPEAFQYELHGICGYYISKALAETIKC